MENHYEDTYQNLRTSFFIVLFSIFVLSSSNTEGKQYSSSSLHSAQTESFLANSSSYQSAILSNSGWLTYLHRYCESVAGNTSFNPLSIPYRITDYNRKITQNFITVKKTRISTGPVPRLEFYFHIHSNKDDDLPFLS